MRRILAGGALALLLAALVLFGRFLVGHDWEWGRQRSLLVLLVGLVALLVRPAERLPAPRSPLVLAALWAAALWAVGHDVATGIESIRRAALTGEIRLDQGQNTLRAAHLLRAGDDPYRRFQLLDLEAWQTRAPQRGQAGLGPALDPTERQWLLQRWWGGLDPEARARLLPPGTTPEALREGTLYGYKYGPLLPLVTAPFEALLGPPAVPLLQLLLYLTFLLLLSLALRAAGLPAVAVPLLLLTLSLEPSAARNYLELSASDVWALAACAGAVLAFLRGSSVALALCTAAALGCKSFPSLLLVPLLLVRPERRALGALGAGLLLLFGPFLLWDPQGLIGNLLRWPGQMAPDNTGWLAWLTTGQLRWARPLLLGALLLLASAFVRSERRRAQPAPPFGALALGSAVAILAGPAFHNNYAPWVTSWAAAALLASFLAPESASAQQPSPSTNR